MGRRAVSAGGNDRSSVKGGLISGSPVSKFSRQGWPHAHVAVRNRPGPPACDLDGHQGWALEAARLFHEGEVGECAHQPGQHDGVGRRASHRFDRLDVRQDRRRISGHEVGWDTRRNDPCWIRSQEEYEGVRAGGDTLSWTTSNHRGGIEPMTHVEWQSWVEKPWRIPADLCRSLGQSLAAAWLGSEVYLPHLRH